MSAMRRTSLMLTVMVAAILLAGGVAFAAFIEGTAGDDTIRGTDDSDAISALAGNDTVFGYGGPDAIKGEEGRDDLFGGDGPDRVDGGTWSDEIVGGPGNDPLYGEAGEDTVSGLAGDDAIYGGDHDDRLFGGNREQTSDDPGNDTLYGELGNDVVVGGFGADTLLGGEGNDRLVEGPWKAAAVDDLRAGAGDDLISSHTHPGSKDLVDCGPGYDKVHADRQDDVSADCENVVIVQDLLSANRAQSGDFTTQAVGDGDLHCLAPGYFRGFLFGDAPCGTATNVDPGNRLLVRVTSSDGQPVAFRGYGTILGRQVGTEVVVTEMSGAELLWEHDGFVRTDVSIEGRVGAFFSRVVDGYWRVNV